MRIRKLISLFLSVIVLLSATQVVSFAAPGSSPSEPLKIIFIDCGRKYFSPESIKAIIDNASSSNFNTIQLGFANDGIRFLLDDMSVGAYTSDQVKEAIHQGNLYYNEVQCVGHPYTPEVNELSQSQMDDIIIYANNCGMEVIPLFNTPGHSNTLITAMGKLGIQNANAPSSQNTINLFENAEAVNFTKDLIQKYIDYFSSRGCRYFNFGADEYANDAGTSGGFISLGKKDRWERFVQYVNDIAALIKQAKMTPIAFNDAFYYAGAPLKSKGFDTDIVICYWSDGWGIDHIYEKPKAVAKKGHKLINTSEAYYWVLGRTNAQCTVEKANGFEYNKFEDGLTGAKINDSIGSMFCIWCDEPGAETEQSVIEKTAPVLKAYGSKIPKDENKMNIGDFNDDKIIDETDYQQLVNFTTDSELLAVKDGTNGYIWTLKADVIQDGVVDALDLSALRKIISGYTVILRLSPRGDINRDGKITESDKAAIRTALSTDEIVNLKSYEKYACDLNGDGLVNEADLPLVDSLVIS